MTLDELDALHAATSPRPWRHQPDGFGGLEIHDSDPQDPAICEANTHDALAIVAIHNAWPEVSARLRAAEAEVERLRSARDTLLAEVTELRAIAEMEAQEAKRRKKKEDDASSR